jgi:beta-glucosidase
MVHNSQEEGHGLADVLFGDYSPAGRLTQTWPTGDAQLLPILNYNLLDGETYMYAKEKPLYAFGYGLSFTTFEYLNITAAASRIEPDSSVQIHVKVRNAGKRESDEVVEMYVQHMGSAVTRPHSELKGFKRVRIGAGSVQDVTLELKGRDLAYWDAQGHVWRVEKEKVRVLAGGSSDKLSVQTTVDVTATKDFKP